MYIAATELSEFSMPNISAAAWATNNLTTNGQCIAAKSVHMVIGNHHTQDLYSAAKSVHSTSFQDFFFSNQCEKFQGFLLFLISS
jgi:hypothetical protein